MKCLWKFDDLDGIYESACGKNFFFETGTAEENGFRFCPFCGRELEFVGAVMAETKKDVRERLSEKPFAPGWVYFCSDMGIVGVMFYAGWFWTGFAFLSATLAAGTARLVLKEGRKKLTTKHPAPSGERR